MFVLMIAGIGAREFAGFQPALRAGVASGRAFVVLDGEGEVLAGENKPVQAGALALAA